MKFLSEEEKYFGRKRGVKEVNQRRNKTEETKTELNERANAELHARLENSSWNFYATSNIYPPWDMWGR